MTKFEKMHGAQEWSEFWPKVYLLAIEADAKLFALRNDFASPGGERNALVAYAMIEAMQKGCEALWTLAKNVMPNVDRIAAKGA